MSDPQLRKYVDAMLQTQQPVIRVENAELSFGDLHVKVAIYTTAIAFPNPTSASQTLELPATKSTIETTLPKLGRFAVGVYQDINSDGELNRNRFGIPTEPHEYF